MAIDTLLVVVGVYGTVDDAKADYELVGDLHKDAGLIDAYDAAVIERTDKGKTKIVKKHETPTRVGGVLGGGMGLATGLVVALFPFAAVGGGLLAGTTAGGAILGAVAGHAAAGMSRRGTCTGLRAPTTRPRRFRPDPRGGTAARPSATPTIDARRRDRWAPRTADAVRRDVHVRRRVDPERVEAWRGSLRRVGRLTHRGVEQLAQRGIGLGRRQVVGIRL